MIGWLNDYIYYNPKYQWTYCNETDSAIRAVYTDNFTKCNENEMIVIPKRDDSEIRANESNATVFQEGGRRLKRAACV